MNKILLAMIVLVLVTISVLIFSWPRIQSIFITFIPEKVLLPKEHLIPDVPYSGQFLGTALSNQESTAVRTLVDYWAIPGVDNTLLRQIFEPTDKEGFASLGTALAAEFFRGYGFYEFGTTTTDKDFIKLMVANDIPVYAKQKLGTAYMDGLISTRVYIGYSDNRQEFIVHDNNFGNNFTIPYDEYDRISPGQFLLIVTPPDFIIDHAPKKVSADSDSYPPRLGIMDDLGLRQIQIRLMELNYYQINTLRHGADTAEAAISALEEIINHEAFDRLHPAARASLAYSLSGYYYRDETRNDQRAIELLEMITTPLIEEYDFSKPFGEWDRKMNPAVYDHPAFDAGPWTRLGYLYLRANDRGKSLSAFQKALEYKPDYQDALNGLVELDR